MGSCVVLGLGNILLGDEGVGVQVVRELEKRLAVGDIEFVDGGTGGFELIPHCRGRETVAIIDAIAANGPPGTVYRVPLVDLELNARAVWSAHQSGLHELVQGVKRLNPPPHVVVFGIVPGSVNAPTMELSENVQKRIPEIVGLIQRELEKMVHVHIPA